MTVFDQDEVDREYRRIARTGWVLIAASVPLTALALLLDPHPIVTGLEWFYRTLFIAIAMVEAFASVFIVQILASSRPLARPAPEQRPPTVPVQVGSLAMLLLTLPFTVLLLGAGFRLLLGGTTADYAVFLATSLGLWAIFFPRRRQFEEWVRERTG